MKWQWQSYSTRGPFPVVSKGYLDCILAESKEGRHQKCCCNNFVITSILKMVFMEMVPKNSFTKVVFGKVFCTNARTLQGHQAASLIFISNSLLKILNKQR